MSDPFVTPWIVACQAPLPMGLPRQENWSGFSFTSPGDLPELGIKPTSPAFAGGLFAIEPSWRPVKYVWLWLFSREVVSDSLQPRGL